MLTDALSAVFEPRRIALVGASEQPGRMGSVFWHNLESFPGEVVPVTQSAETVFGRPSYRSLRDVEGEIDLAVVIVPAAAVPAVIRDAGTKGVPAAVIISGGFAEAGPAGAALQEEVMHAARQGGVRVVGPNCFGVQNCDLPLNASFAQGLPPGGGGITLVTQSGAYGMAIFAVGLDEGTRFAKIYAAGNKADITDAELLGYLGADPASRTLCFFLESLPDGRAFVDTARSGSATPNKPVIVARTGRSPAGSRAAISHTAALAGDQQIWQAAFDQAGVVVARSGLEMLDAARALDTQPVPAGARIAVITNSGGTGVELADLLTEEGLDVPELSPALQDELRAVLPAYASAVNPVDMTPIWSRYAELYPLLIDRLARSGEVDVVVPVLLQRSATDEAAVAAVRDAVGRLRADDVGVPVYVCWVTPRSARHHAEVLQQAGVPCFDWPERTARAVRHAVRHGEARNRPRTPVRSPHRPAGLATLPTGMLDPETGARLLKQGGITVVETRTCDRADDAVAAATALGYPVVAKVAHPEFVHKTDVGGVRTGLPDETALRDAAESLLAVAPGARVLVQPEVAGVELVIGGLRDPQFGPLVMVGVGGTLVEVLGDVGFALAPLSADDAHRVLGGLRAQALLTGVRGSAPADVDALVGMITAVGDLVAAVPEITELDLNPVIVTPAGPVAVDWRIRIESPREPQE